MRINSLIILILGLMDANAWATYEIVVSSLTSSELTRISHALTGAQSYGSNSDGYGATSIYWIQPSTYTVSASPNALSWGN